MRVLFAIDSLEAGGAERSLVEQIAPLRERGVHLDIVTQRTTGVLVDEARAAGAAVHPIGAGTRRGSLSAMDALIGELAPDVVHTTLFESHLVGRVAAARAGIPVLSSVVGAPYGEDHRRSVGRAKGRAAQFADASTAHLVTRLHAPAAHLADTMARRLGVRRDRFTVIPRARDVDRLGQRTPQRRSRARRELGLDDDAVVVAILARHEPPKGLDVAVEAIGHLVEQHPSLVVVVAGRSGTASDALEALARRTGVDERCRWLGHRDDVGEVLCAADLLAAPSRREGLPGALIEAAALEVPIVAADLPGVREVLGDRLGLLVTPGAPEALAGGIADVLADPSCAGDLAAGRRRMQDEFAPTKVADATVALWEQVISEPVPRSARAARAARRR